MPRKKRTRNKKDTKPNVFVQKNPSEVNSSQNKQNDIQNNKISSKAKKNEVRSIKTRTEVYTRTQSKELKKIGLIGMSNLIILIIIAFIL
ncbi:MAG: hypothetical protein CL780_03545 [Chloroflexi bacterium]|nr:hypothetical protein [Chloroflexota bacterium]|tara:strand:- start:1 stop:270 length:270 start_codon:yes stop_codon:yes gene_type:complete